MLISNERQGGNKKNLNFRVGMFCFHTDPKLGPLLVCNVVLYEKLVNRKFITVQRLSHLMTEAKPGYMSKIFS